MPNFNMSAEFVRNAACPDGKAKETYYDNAITGFVLETRASGGKTYALRYRDQHGRQCQHKIGDAASISFDKARLTAAVLRSRVVLGESPSEERKAKRLVPTVAEFAVTYLDYVKGYKKSWSTDDSMLRTHVLPKFGKYHLDEITEQAVIEYHQGLVQTAGYKASSANKVLVLLSYMYVVAKKFKTPGAENNPAAGVKLFEAASRERFLTPEETQRLKLAVEASENPQLKHIVALSILSGCRKRELLDARWEDFDLERRNWRIPMTKNGKPRHVPLSSSALAVLAQIPKWEGCPYVLPNPKTKLPFVSYFYSWNTARKQAGLPEVRVHDLRHSFASNCVNQKVSIYEVATLLGHASVSTTAKYAHLSRDTLLAAAEASASATGIDWGTAQAVKTGENLALTAA